MPDFMSVLNKKVDSIEKPKPKPPGWYVLQAMGMPKEVKRNVNGEEVGICSFSFKVIAAHEVDDQEALASGPPITEWSMFNKDFWTTSERFEWNLIQFLTNVLGIEPSNAKGQSKTIGEMFSEVPGKQILGKLKVVPYTDKTTNQTELATNLDECTKL